MWITDVAYSAANGLLKDRCRAKNRAHFRGKRCCVTGGASGIGLQLVLQLLGAGAAVFVIDCDAEALKHLDPSVGRIQIDLAEGDPDETSARAVDAALAFLDNDLDLWVNNAGITCLALLSRTDARRIRLQHRVNLEMPILLTHRLLDTMAKRTSRKSPVHVAFTSSIASEVSGSMMTSYFATKAGLRHFAASLQREDRVAPWQYPFRVRCTTVCPNYVRTNLVGEKSWDMVGGAVRYTAEDVAEAFLSGVRRGQLDVYVRVWDPLLGVMDRCLPFMPKVIGTKPERLKHVDDSPLVQRSCSSAQGSANETKKDC